MKKEIKRKKLALRNNDNCHDDVTRIYSEIFISNITSISIK